jgi:hypothetical protein
MKFVVVSHSRGVMLVRPATLSHLIATLAVVLSCFISGCGYKIVKAHTDFVLHSDARRDELIKKYAGPSSVWQSGYNNAANGDAKKLARNDILNDLLWLADDYYGQLTNQLHTNNAWRETLFDAAKLGLSAAGSVAGGTELKAILAATSTGVQGLNTSIDKNFYAQQSVEAIIAAMDSQRAEDKKLLVTGMTQLADQNASPYPLSQGLVDVQKYALDSTLTHALIALSQKAAAAANKSTLELSNMQLAQYQLNYQDLIQAHQAVDQVFRNSASYTVANLQLIPGEATRNQLAGERFALINLTLDRIATLLADPVLPAAERDYFVDMRARLLQERNALATNFAVE